MLRDVNALGVGNLVGNCNQVFDVILLAYSLLTMFIFLGAQTATKGFYQKQLRFALHVCLPCCASMFACVFFPPR